MWNQYDARTQCCEKPTIFDVTRLVKIIGDENPPPSLLSVYRNTCLDTTSIALINDLWDPYIKIILPPNTKAFILDVLIIDREQNIFKSQNKFSIGCALLCYDQFVLPYPIDGTVNLSITDYPLIPPEFGRSLTAFFILKFVV